MIAYEIRKGRETDIPALLAQIKQLAEFEKAAERVATNETRLLADWHEHHAFDFLVAVADDQVVGISLYYPRYSTWNGRCYYLEDLHVSPAYRGMGIWPCLAESHYGGGPQAGAGRLDWQVLDWND
ncbi:MAG: GNAT family N-acetyltransferase [Owenweeksia sp.]|nr:GNAT family N-acetyltransferase [Owenweeksia sp.]